MERVETLTGAPRSTFRRNDEVVTFLPDRRWCVPKSASRWACFPTCSSPPSSQIAEFYGARRRAANGWPASRPTWCSWSPRTLRFGYRIWSEKKTGLVVKLQTLDTEGEVLEQVAFSELQLDAPVSMDKLAQMMDKTEGYRVEKPGLVKTTAGAEGWRLKKPVPGFQPMSCYKRPRAARRPAMRRRCSGCFPMGWRRCRCSSSRLMPQRHVQEKAAVSMGATQSLTRRVDDLVADRGGRSAAGHPAACLPTALSAGNSAPLSRRSPVAWRVAMPPSL